MTDSLEIELHNPPPPPTSAPTGASPRRRAMAEALEVTLHNRLSYDSETGLFTWLVSSGRVRTGAIAGALKPHGYVVIQVAGLDELWRES